MRNRAFVFLVLLAFVPQLFSQSVNFVNTPADARLVGIGNAGFVLESPFAVQRNFASSLKPLSPKSQVGVSYLRWQPTVSSNSMYNAAGYSRFDKFSLGASFRYNSYGAIDISNEQGQVSGSASPMEYAVDLGFGYQFSERITLGVALRYIHSDMGSIEKASAVSTDLSLLYSKNRLSAGLGLTNLGTKVNYGYSDYSLPMRIQSGVSYYLYSTHNHSVTAVADLAYQVVPSFSGVIAALGGEYAYNKMFFVRTGYHYEDALVGSSYATLGLGVTYTEFSLDLAYVIANSAAPLNQTMIVTLKWSL